jgi:2-iminobutanoate/2-iminopropanoate deaminase
VTHHRHVVHADGAPAALGPYSHGVVSNGLLFCAGQIPIDPQSGELVEGGAGEQTARCLDNLTAVCEAAGARLADAVRLTLYCTDLAGDWNDINQAYASYFDEDAAPARSALRRCRAAHGSR